MSYLFEHVVLQGVGLLGASLGLALKNRGIAGRVTGVGRAGTRSLEVALRRKAVDAVSTDLAAAVAGEQARPADLVVLCTPIRQFPAAFRALAPALVPGTIITDVGSTKEQVMAWAQEMLPGDKGIAFVGSHPMAGSEKSGPEAAREDLYEGALCLICGKADEPTARIKGLWKRVGMRILELPAQEHDRWVAAISHLPHAAAFALVQAAGKHPEMLEAVAGGFIDSTRVASSDPTMWTDIFMTNRDAVVEALDRYSGELAGLRAAIAQADETAVRRYLERAKSVRDKLLAERAAPVQSKGGNGGSE